MISIDIHFTGGRYHATPWQRHVNEGAVEWPPSPWRILRALIAVRHRKHPDIPEDVLRKTIDKLSSPPSFFLPDPSSGHTRHYMPKYKGSMNNEKAMIFDAFYRIPRNEPIRVIWHDVDLNEEDINALELLVSSLSYLGRAESWVSASLSTQAGSKNPIVNSFPIGNSSIPNSSIPTSFSSTTPSSPTEPSDPTSPAEPSDPTSPAEPADPADPSEQHSSATPPYYQHHDETNTEILSILAPETAENYKTWRTMQVETLQSKKLKEKQLAAKEKEKDPKKAKLSKKEIEKIETILPIDLYSCLLMETSEYQENGLGWTHPPGTRKLEYIVPRTKNTSISQMEKHVSKEMDRPTAGVFILASDTVHGDVRPQITHGLYLAETTRQALMSKSKDKEGIPAQAFSGKDKNGKPLKGHQHAYILPGDDDNDGRIDHIIVYRREGFGDVEQKSLSAMRKLWQHKSKPDLFPILIGIGRPQDFAGSPGPQGRCPALDRSTTWLSRTPYLLTRHPKKNGKDSPEDQVRRDILNSGLNLPEPTRIETLPSHQAGAITKRKKYRWIEFARDRKTGKGRRASTIGYSFRITFPKEVEGPIALGYGAHFGLGLFWPEEHTQVHES